MFVTLVGVGGVDVFLLTSCVGMALSYCDTTGNIGHRMRMMNKGTPTKTITITIITTALGTAAIVHQKVMDKPTKQPNN